MGQQHVNAEALCKHCLLCMCSDSTGCGFVHHGGQSHSDAPLILYLKFEPVPDNSEMLSLRTRHTMNADRLCDHANMNLSRENLCLSDQIRSDYISSSHTRLIRCLTHWVHLMQASIDKPDNSN